VAAVSPAPFIARIVESTTPTAIGTLTLTSTGIGPVQGFMLGAARVSAEDTMTQGYSICTGYADRGGRERCVSIWGQDNILPTNCGTQGTRNAVLRLLDPTSGATLVVAHYDGPATDGIILDFTQIEATAWKFYVVLFAGAQTACFVGDAVPNAIGAANKTVTTGIAQDFILTSSMPIVSETTSHDHAIYFNGVATRDDEDAFFTGFIAHDNELVSSSTRRVSRNDGINQTITLAAGATTSGGKTDIVNHSSTGFEILSTGAGAIGTRFAYIAVEAGGATAVAVESSGFTTQTATGNFQHTEPGHTTGFLYMNWSGATTQNSVANQGSGGFGCADGFVEVSICGTDENAVALSNTGMIYRNRIIDLFSDAQVELAEASFVSKDAGVGFTINYSTAPATGRRGTLLSVQEMPLQTIQGETVTVSDAMRLVKSSLVTSETVTVSDSQGAFVTAVQYMEPVQISEAHNFFGAAIIVAATEPVSISETARLITGTVLTVGESVFISDSATFGAGPIAPVASSGPAKTLQGGAELGNTVQGGVARAGSL
jgi:hypothetical protein